MGHLPPFYLDVEGGGSGGGALLELTDALFAEVIQINLLLHQKQSGNP